MSRLFSGVEKEAVLALLLGGGARVMTGFLARMFFAIIGFGVRILEHVAAVRPTCHMSLSLAVELAGHIKYEQRVDRCCCGD